MSKCTLWLINNKAEHLDPKACVAFLAINGLTVVFSDPALRGHGGGGDMHMINI